MLYVDAGKKKNEALTDEYISGWVMTDRWSSVLQNQNKLN